MNQPKDALRSLRQTFERDGIRRVKLGGFDIDGILRGKYVSLDKFWSITEGGVGFCDVIFGWDSADLLYDRPTVTGWHSGYPDTLARIDLETYRRIPWEPEVAAFLLDFEDQKGAPLAVSPRQVLKRVLDQFAEKGLQLVAAAELEFFIYRETQHTVREKNYRGLAPISPGMFGYSWLRTSQNDALCRDLFEQMTAFEIPVEGFHTETGPGVYEAAIRYTDALTAADRAALFKTAAKEIGHRHGVMPCFMAKPSEKLPGCSGHLHQSLWRGETNLFFDPAEPRGLSKTLRHYVGGQLALMPELMAMIGPTINSYKRLVTGTWAPTAATWGVENRTCAVRAIPGSSSSTRLEFRIAAADMNPYLALAAAAASGLYGIENAIEPPAAVTGNAYEAKDAPLLPKSLRQATETFQASAHARRLFGEVFVDHFALTREFECRQAEAAVTDWELARYFEVV